MPGDVREDENAFVSWARFHAEPVSRRVGTALKAGPQAYSHSVLGTPID
jgi:hypothetical protein